jgi:UDP-3-O-acyl N-acetylglucosamine deacetylase
VKLKTRNQQTIRRPATVQGFGYWSGLDVRLEFRPAPIDAGLTFVRRDVIGSPRIPVDIDNRADVPRRTVLASRGVSVDMVEHVLAALAGLRIDNCEIWVDRAEMPGCDGSSQAFVEALLGSQIVQQDAPRRQWIIDHSIEVHDGETWLRAEPDFGQLTIEYHLEYSQCPAIGRQSYCLEMTPRSFVEQLALSRTFVLDSEAQWFREQGFGRRATYQDLLVFGAGGPIGNALRFPDECVRHKTLDVLGDLALAPFDIVGRIIANRSGHHLNAELIRRLVSDCRVAQPLLKSA